MNALGKVLQLLTRRRGFLPCAEGLRSLDERRYRGRTGATWLALVSGAPLEPIASSGEQDRQLVG